jgi:Uma2 family endonuclease
MPLAASPEAILQLDAEGRLIVMTPTVSETSGRNSQLIMRLLLWADRQGGRKVFDSSGGFLLPDGSVRSPDASVVRLQRWAGPHCGAAARFRPPSARNW